MADNLWGRVKDFAYRYAARTGVADARNDAAEREAHEHRPTHNDWTERQADLRNDASIAHRDDVYTVWGPSRSDQGWGGHQKASLAAIEKGNDRAQIKAMTNERPLTDRAWVALDLDLAAKARLSGDKDGARWYVETARQDRIPYQQQSRSLSR